MVDRKVVVIVAVAVGVVLVGGIAGAMLLGGGDDGNSDGGAEAGDGSDGGGSAATPTSAPTPAGNGTATNGTAMPTETAFPTLTPTDDSTPTGTPTVTPTATPIPTRTAKLPRRFSERAIELELRRLINDWREDQGLDPYTNANGSLVQDINAMSLNHSRAMAETGELDSESNNLTVAERYEAFELKRTCKFKEAGRENIVTPDRYRFQLIDKTYAGRNYEEDGETIYHENETQIARDIFETWTSNFYDSDVLSWENSNRLGIGIEITQTNEVWVTGNICGSGPTK